MLTSKMEWNIFSVTYFVSFVVFFVVHRFVNVCEMVMLLFSPYTISVTTTALWVCVGSSSFHMHFSNFPGKHLAHYSVNEPVRGNAS